MKIKYYGDNIEKNEKSLVLCGPSPRDSATPSWRPEAIKILEELGFEGTVYIPEYSSSIRFDSYFDQVN